MQAIIPAAGMGRRLKGLTEDKAKCMVPVNGITLIERMLRQLDNLGLARIIIIVGHQGQKLIDFIGTLNIVTPIIYIDNPVYDKTNNIYSLALANDFLVEDDTLILESDLIFEDSVLTELINDSRDTLTLVDKYESWMDGTVVKIKDDDTIADIITGFKMDYSDTDYYKTVNIYKFSKEFSASLYVPFLKAYLHALGTNQYYEQVLRVITILDNPIIKTKRLTGQRWYEIDNIQDLDIAASMFEPDDDKRLDLIQKRYGGYWRYPKLIDFCYLVNQFFPPQKMINEISFSFETLMRSYPSGSNVNSLVAAKKFNVDPEHIVVGNGAAELIKSLMENINGNVGLIYPTFEEYPNRLPEEKRIVFIPNSNDYAYSENDVINFFDDKNIETLLLINPDNPTGNYIRRSGVINLIEWASAKNIKIIVDDSFADFSDEYPVCLIDNDIINKYNNLIVVKSISKSYGVPGLRLGVLASSDRALIGAIKKDIAIWNINSFGEFYLQIEEKYNSDYKRSLEALREARRKLSDDLKLFEALRVIPSQADFIAVEILTKMTARELTKILFIKYNMLIKDLSGKAAFAGKQYVRIAVRTEEDNNRLIFALKEIFGY